MEQEPNLEHEIEQGASSAEREEARQWFFYHLGVTPNEENIEAQVSKAYQEQGLTPSEALDADKAWIDLCSRIVTPSFLMLEDLITGIKKRRQQGEGSDERTKPPSPEPFPCLICGGREYLWGEVEGAPTLTLQLESDSNAAYPLKARCCANCGNVQIFAQGE